MIFVAWVGILSQICEIFESQYLTKYTLDQHEIWRGISGAQLVVVVSTILTKIVRSFIILDSIKAFYIHTYFLYNNKFSNLDILLKFRYFTKKLTENQFI